MSNLMRGLAAAAQAAVNSGVSSYGDAAKRGKQEYNREQSRRSAGRYRQKQTPDEYNMMKAREMMGMEGEPKADKPIQNSAATKALMHEQALKSKPYLRNKRRG